MRSLKWIALFLLLVFSCQQSMAQSVRIYKKDNTSITIPLSQLDSLVAFGEEEVQFVDLGLSVKWGAKNIGAQTPEDFGYYFAWGEVMPKDAYTEENNVTYGKHMGNIAGNEVYDAATAMWGSPARMPTLEELNELVRNCWSEWTMQNGVYGRLVTSKINGNSIFFPSTGKIEGTTLTSEGAEGYFWTISPYEEHEYSAYTLCATHDYFDWYFTTRGIGATIRPVQGNGPVVTVPYAKTDYPYTVGQDSASIHVVFGNVPENATCGVEYTDGMETLVKEVQYVQNDAYLVTLKDLNPGTTYRYRAFVTWEGEPVYGKYREFKTQEITLTEGQWIDMGVSVQWAAYNVGATRPEEKGEYFAWGNIVPTQYYYADSCVTWEKQMSSIEGDPRFDAATAQWGAPSRLPSKEELDELLSHCKTFKTNYQGVPGYLLTSEVNGNTLFFPCGGEKKDKVWERDGEGAYYWTGTPHRNYAYERYQEAWCYRFQNERVVGPAYRNYGYSVRAVQGGPVLTLPSAKTGDVKEVGQTTASVYAMFGDVPEHATCGIEYTVGDVTRMQEVENVTDDSCLVTLSGLYPGTVYRYRAVVKWKSEPVYGEYKEFTTQQLVVSEGQWIDMGVSVQWAAYNLGATRPEEKGDYFAWGNTAPSMYFYTEDCATWGRPMGNIEGDPQYDAAVAQWGAPARMPSKEDFDELLQNCTKVKVDYQGVPGFLLTSNVNGNTLFFPCGGSKCRDEFDDDGVTAEYWSGTPYKEVFLDQYQNAWRFQLELSNEAYVGNRNIGCNVRAVRKGESQAEPVATTGLTTNVTAHSAEVYAAFEHIPEGARCGIEYVDQSTGYVYGKYLDVPAEGEVMILLTDLNAATTYRYRAVVEYYGTAVYGSYMEFTTAPKSDQDQWVDMGVSVKWAAYNVGATSPEGLGDYFAWGETSPKWFYSPDSYWAPSLDNISGNADYDAATAQWGDGARMPTRDEFQELLNNCYSQWTSSNGRNGLQLTSKVNGNTLFLPAAGLRFADYTDKVDEQGWYRTASASEGLPINLPIDANWFPVSVSWNTGAGYWGYSVRAVKGEGKPAQPEAITGDVTDITEESAVVTATFKNVPADAYCGVEYYNDETGQKMNHQFTQGQEGTFSERLPFLKKASTYSYRAYILYAEGMAYGDFKEFTTLGGSSDDGKWVDMGVSIKWAAYNVGATSPEDPGDYFAWGETSPKSFYSTDNYWAPSLDNISGNADYDAATAQWGDGARMPTLDEFRELLNNCYSQWTSSNGRNGLELTSKVNGNTLFLPAAGLRFAEFTENVDKQGWYRTASASDGQPINLPIDANWFPVSVSWNTGAGYWGYSVRAVKNK